jgi:hypothetical protein
MKNLTTALMLGVFATTGCVTLPEIDKKAEINNSQEKTRGLSNDKIPVMADQINTIRNPWNCRQIITNKARDSGPYYKNDY